jgi:hypothetical protein
VSVALAALTASLVFVTASAAAPSPADWMYEPTTFTEIRLELPPESFELLEDVEYDDYVEGTFQIAETDGVPGHAGPLSAPLTVGIKLKGGLGSRRPITEKAGLKIKFDEFVDGQTFLGLEKMTLNNMVQDPTMTHEVLAYQAFRRMGVFAPHTGFAYVWVNGRSYGLHLNLESLDKIALEKRFGPFQNPPQHLYEGELGADVSTEINPRTGKQRIEDFEVDEGKNKTRTDLTTLLAAVDGSTGTYSERVAPYADLDQMTRMWMTERYIGHWDGYTGFLPGHFVPNNYYLYSNPAGQFQILPWGTDQTWGEHIDFSTPSVGALFAKCLPDSACLDLYRQAGAEALTALDALRFDTSARCTAAAVRPWREYEVATSEAAKLPPYDLQESSDWSTWEREFIAERPAELAAYLGVAAPPAVSQEWPCPPLRPIGGFQPPPTPEEPQKAPDAAPAMDATGPPATATVRSGRRTIRTNAIGLALRASIPGRLTAVGTFGAAGHRAVGCRGRAEATGTGTVSVSCRLTGPLRRRLESGPVRLRLAATLTPAAGEPATWAKTIRLPGR